MKSGILTKCILASALAALLSGCLTQETVTSNGQVISQDYVIKRPLKDAIERSE
jgi:outer membrane protein assembly factor BamE (lipoprotein component of BamABCDE complex)